MGSVTEIKGIFDLKSKTFSQDEKLPPHPSPNLQRTIKIYLDSCKAVLSYDEYLHTEALCKKFLEDEGEKLHSLFKNRISDNNCWFVDFWMSYIYLERRSSVITQNISGPGSYSEHYWPLQKGTQLQRAATSLCIFMQFWELVRKERLAPHFLQQKPLSMHQFRYLFNTCRIPRKDKDEIYHGFCTESEGASPTHIIVLCQGRMFRIEGFDFNSGKSCTFNQFYRMLEYICEVCRRDGRNSQGVSVLTAMDRNKWAEARKHLIHINPSNHNLLKQIETSLYVLALSDETSKTYTEMAYEACVGTGNLCWYDKSYCAIVNANGGIMFNCEHSPYDAMVTVAFAEFTTQMIKRNKGVWKDMVETNDFVLPVELIFDLDQRSFDFIAEARLQLYQMRQNADLLLVVFEKFGKQALKKYNVHPDFMVQLCIQLAYMQVHGKPASTYKAATTRQYYRGRTNVCRTCTPEVVAFCKAMLVQVEPGSKKQKELIPLLQTAHAKFLSVMHDCMMNESCDPHLAGLRLICRENDMDLPELFTDKAYTLSGGNRNYTLLTSYFGPFHCHGLVLPVVEYGYGFIYRINDHKITYSISAFNSSPDTNAQKLSDCFEYFLASVFYVLKTDRSSKL